MIESDKPNTRKRYRSKNGQPRTYFDSNTGRFIAPDLPEWQRLQMLKDLTSWKAYWVVIIPIDYKRYS
jgi:hypothetical protein